jgi:acetylxylan esterase
MLTLAAQLLMISQVFAGPVEVQKRQNCPSIHVFGARETTAPAGYGSAGAVVDSIVNAHPGATSEAIDYPAAGDSQYGASVQAGFAAVGSQVTTFAQGCPDTQLVLVGYSQVSTQLIN